MPYCFNCDGEVEVIVKGKYLICNYCKKNIYEVYENNGENIE